MLSTFRFTKTIKDFIRRIFHYNKIRIWFVNQRFDRKYKSSQQYWETRYDKNGTSGNGSYGEIAKYKAEILNKFLKENDIRTVLELGCGDGNQLKYLQLPRYIGLDISVAAVERCIRIFKEDHTKSFFIYHHSAFADNFNLFRADLVLSLDVIYHLLEDEVYESYMTQLFSFSRKYVIIYAWDVEGEKKLHVRHRKFSEWVKTHETNWLLTQKIGNEKTPTCDFFIYQKEK